MHTLISNYVNGNLETAKHQARRHSFTSILAALRESGYSAEASIAIAAFLKGQGTFQAACDAEFQDRCKEQREGFAAARADYTPTGHRIA